MKLLAHLTNYHSVRKEQSLKEHCLQTASYAAGSIGSTELYHTIYLAGILHDAGKQRKNLSIIWKMLIRESLLKGELSITLSPE